MFIIILEECECENEFCRFVIFVESNRLFNFWLDEPFCKLKKEGPTWVYQSIGLERKIRKCQPIAFSWCRKHLIPWSMKWFIKNVLLNVFLYSRSYNIKKKVHHFFPQGQSKRAFKLEAYHCFSNSFSIKFRFLENWILFNLFLLKIFFWGFAFDVSGLQKRQIQSLFNVNFIKTWSS